MYCCNLNIEATEAMPTMGFAGPALTRRHGKWKVWCVALSWSALGPKLPAGPVSYGLLRSSHL